MKKKIFVHNKAHFNKEQLNASIGVFDIETGNAISLLVGFTIRVIVG